MTSTIAFLMIFLLGMGFSHAAPTAVIRGGTVIRNGVIGPLAADPCEGVAVGDPCPNGVLYGGTGFAGLGSYKYMTTPGNCTDSATPTCNGTTDTLGKKWANFSGTTAHGVNTGATSTTDGASNTTILATNYTDTDAAQYCENMTYPPGGYTDWYLPSKDELRLVLYAMKVAGKGNFDPVYYWSSTQSANSYAWGKAFYNTDEAGVIKTNTHKLRCVRKY